MNEVDWQEVDIIAADSLWKIFESMKYQHLAISRVIHDVFSKRYRIPGRPNAIPDIATAYSDFTVSRWNAAIQNLKEHLHQQISSLVAEQQGNATLDTIQSIREVQEQQLGVISEAAEEDVLYTEGVYETRDALKQITVSRNFFQFLLPVSLPSRSLDCSPCHGVS